MNFLYKLFVVVFVLLLCFCNAQAEKYACPEGCFCLNDGKVDSDLIKELYGWTGSKYNTKQALDRLAGICKGPSTTFPVTQNFSCNMRGYVAWWAKGGNYKIVCNREKYLTDYPDGDNDPLHYFLKDFSELYSGTFGVYGIANNKPIYISESAFYDNTFQCPLSYPISASGAKDVTDCYKYDIKGKKVYYKYNSTERVAESAKEIQTCGWIASVICQPGYYVPANTSECKTCPSGNACPGGMFYLDKTYTVDRGKTVCEFGVYDDHTACKENINNKTPNKKLKKAIVLNKEELEEMFFNKTVVESVGITSGDNASGINTPSTTNTTDTEADDELKKTKKGNSKVINKIGIEKISLKSAVMPIGRSSMVNAEPGRVDNNNAISSRSINTVSERHGSALARTTQNTNESERKSGASRLTR